MSGVKKTLKRAYNFGTFKGFKTNREIRHKKAAAKQRVLDDQYSNAQLPDDEQVQRDQRRKAAKRKGSRVDNVLTDTLG